MQNGLEYVIVVRATNLVGLRQQATSDGFTVDATAPVSRRVVIVSPSPSNFDIQQITARYGAVKKAGNFTVKTVLSTDDRECTVILHAQTVFDRSLYLYRKKAHRNLQLQCSYCKRSRSNTCQITGFFLNTVHYE